MATGRPHRAWPSTSARSNEGAKAFEERREHVKQRLGYPRMLVVRGRACRGQPVRLRVSQDQR